MQSEDQKKLENIKKFSLEMRKNILHYISSSPYYFKCSNLNWNIIEKMYNNGVPINELDIYDIPISKITKEFVDVVETWEKMNLHVAGDFIVMASTLMRIKAKLLLPRPELDDEGEIIDPRTELIQQLVEYKRFKND